MTTPCPTASEDQVFIAHIMALRGIVLRYRFSRGHMKCGPTDGVVSVDARCPVCREADDVLATPHPRKKP